MKKLTILTMGLFLIFSCLSLAETRSAEKRAEIEESLNLANNLEKTWTYSADSDSWTLSIVAAVTNPLIPGEEGVSVCVPGAYVEGIDTDTDGEADVTAQEAGVAIHGNLVIDYDTEIVSSNGQTYTADTAPVILNTGAAGYGHAANTLASSEYAAEGYINIACGNRGKQDTYTDEDGNVLYTGDAPSCLVDQKAAARFVRYNILLGNLPGSTEYWVTTGGSGGGAHAVMFAATSNHPDFYDYQIALGAVGVYLEDDGSYSTAVSIDDNEYDISDGAWGCVAYSPITSLYEADMAMAMEYTLDANYTHGTSFQQALAFELALAYMDYINEQELAVWESDVGFDLDGDGQLESLVDLTIEHEPNAYPQTNGFHGTYLDLYLAEFTENLQWYLDNLDHAQGWTWFDADGNPLSDEAVAGMTLQEKAEAFVKGLYTKASGGSGPRGKRAPDGMRHDFGKTGVPEEMPRGDDEMIVGTPDAGTTQAAGNSVDSINYSTFEDMLTAYQTDLDQILLGDEYGNNIVDLYNPLNYIGADETKTPAWVRIVCGAAEGDISMLNSLNLELAFLDASVDASIEWQWDGGHVPGEIFGNSLALWIDSMYGEYVGGVEGIQRSPAEKPTKNGEATEPSGTDLSQWVAMENGKAFFSLEDIAAYRTSGASKACPGFDVIDYGQEDYVFGDSHNDARHWSERVLEALEGNAEELAPLFNRN